MRYLALIVSSLMALPAVLGKNQEIKQGERIVFLGDSITAAGARPGGYISQVRERIQSAFPGLKVEVFGAGIGGHKVPDCQKRLDRDVISKKPTLVFIYIGINDVWHWNRNKGTPKDVFESGLKDLVQRCNDAGARVVLCTPSVIGEKVDGSNEYDEMLDAYSAISRKVARDTKSEMCDLRAAFMTHLKVNNKANAEKGLLTGDTVHLNADGNTFVARQILDHLSVPRSTLGLPALFSDHMVLQQGKPIRVWGWTEPGEEVTVSFAGKTAKGRANAEGRWRVQLPALKANAKPRKLLVSGANTIELNDVLVGEVWLCSGQSNMEWRMKSSMHRAEEMPKANYPNIRLFKVDRKTAPVEQKDVKGNWQSCTPQSVESFSAVGYHFGQHLFASLDVPVGLIQSAWGGTEIEPWTHGPAFKGLTSLKDISELVGKLTPQARAGAGTPTGIYNGMIHGLAPYSLRGAIWYQGESNCLKGDTAIYTDKTRALVEGWRKVFQQADLSFYYVQIAPFNYKQAFAKRNKDLTVTSLPRFWDAQAACMEQIENCGMVVVSDITGNVKNIHPGNKRDVGDRLARWALARNYGKDLVYQGPRFASMSTKDGKAFVTFNHQGGGLQLIEGDALKAFTIAGADRKFVPAEAVIKGDGVVVSSPEVSEPLAVRFAWHETAVGNLGNAEGLPALQFRTDDWEDAVSD